MLYEYACVECRHEWEADQRITEAPLRHCPACGKEGAKRLVSGGAGFLLKGGGWYSDLYGLRSSAAKDSGASESSTTKSESSTAKGAPASPDKPAGTPAAATKPAETSASPPAAKTASVVAA